MADMGLGAPLTAVTITSTIGATCHYWFSPQPIQDVSGAANGVLVPNIVSGWTAETAVINQDDDNGDDQNNGEFPVGTPTTLTVELDNTYLWNVALTFRGAPPIYYDGFSPDNGGDLLTLLYAQGWVPL